MTKKITLKSRQTILRILREAIRQRRIESESGNNSDNAHDRVLHLTDLMIKAYSIPIADLNDFASQYNIE